MNLTEEQKKQRIFDAEKCEEKAKKIEKWSLYLKKIQSYFSQKWDKGASDPSIKKLLERYLTFLGKKETVFSAEAKQWRTTCWEEINEKQQILDSAQEELKRCGQFSFWEYVRLGFLIFRFWIFRRKEVQKKKENKPPKKVPPVEAPVAAEDESSVAEFEDSGDPPQTQQTPLAAAYDGVHRIERWLVVGGIILVLVAGGIGIKWKYFPSSEDVSTSSVVAMQLQPQPKPQPDKLQPVIQKSVFIAASGSRLNGDRLIPNQQLLQKGEWVIFLLPNSQMWVFHQGKHISCVQEGGMWKSSSGGEELSFDISPEIQTMLVFSQKNEKFGYLELEWTPEAEQNETLLYAAF